LAFLDATDSAPGVEYARCVAGIEEPPRAVAAAGVEGRACGVKVVVPLALLTPDEAAAPEAGAEDAGEGEVEEGAPDLASVAVLDAAAPFAACGVYVVAPPAVLTPDEAGAGEAGAGEVDAGALDLAAVADFEAAAPLAA
jgi:hypothetical protein